MYAIRSYYVRLQDYFEIVPDYERLLLYKVDVDELVSVLRKAFNQLQIFTLKQGQYQVPVYLSGQEKDLHQIIQSARVRSQNKQDIPVASLVSVREDVDYKTLEGGKSDSYINLDYKLTQKESYNFV